MLKKIIKLQGIGLFANGVPAPANFDRVTLLYAENGRGKSTLAMLLRACSLGDTQSILAKKTLDAAIPPEATFLFDLAGKNMPVEFLNGTWNRSLPQIAVFDAEFVEQNVYSGQEVRPEQRQALLEFALGDAAVALQRQIADLTGQIRDATNKRRDAEQRIAAVAQQMPTTQFIGLAPVPDASVQMDALRKRIDSAKNATTLISRQAPALLVAPPFDVDGFFAALAKKLDDIERNAESIVREHFAKHAAPAGIEAWISGGQPFVEADGCPFCGQSLNGLSLIEAYKSYFNDAYSSLKQQVAALPQQAATGLADARIEALTGQVDTNAARIAAWMDRLDLAVPAWPSEQLIALIAGARDVASRLAAAKQGQPLEAIGDAADRSAVAAPLAEMATLIDDYNREVRATIGIIDAFKKKLDTEDVAALEAQIHSLRIAIARQHSDAIQAVADYQAADGERATLDGKKTNVRAQLDQLMTTTLTQYQVQINDRLKKFGAGFVIEQMRPNYQGTGHPRTDYGLRLRENSVPLGSRKGAGAHFASTLSEGDKRTLAFAFFLARVEADPAALQGQILVIDDPVASLDRNRRAQTVELLSQLAAKSAQIIVLSHDAFFTRDLRDMLAKNQPPIIPRIATVARVAKDYSAFAVCDIDDLCASDYYRHHRQLSEYVSGAYQGHIRDVAKAIRLFLEGFYHRRFPGLLPVRSTFGNVILKITQAAPGTPISHLKPRVPEMLALNNYASRFHHDTNPGNADTEPVTDGELKPYVDRALDLVYRG